MNVIAKCWTCEKRHDITRIQFGQELKCECGGYVVTKTGKASITIQEDKPK